MNTENLVDRIVGALTFRTAVYDEVEEDALFTQTAWILVAVVGFLNQLGTRGGIVAAIVGTLFVLVGFYLFAAVVGWVGRGVFKATVSTEELIRTLGLAYVWNVFGVLGILSGGLAALIGAIAALLGLAASLFAAKAALDLEWVQTIVTVVIGFIVLLVVLAIAGAVLAALGLAAGVATGVVR